ncbi:MAG: tape measure protein [Desulfobulbus sp.]|nr:tape measure protein [Desulfobulbus sp.]
MANNLELALRIRADLKQAYDSLGQLTSGFGRLDGSVATARRGLDSISDTLSRNETLVKRAGAAWISYSQAMSLINLADQYGQMASRIKMATSSTEEYQMVQARLLETAQNTYRPLAEAQEAYIRTADALRSLGYTTAQALDVSDSLSYLLVTNAASGERAAGAIDAFSRALQTGKVDALGWKTILAATPSVVDAIALATGKAAEEIRKLGAAGDLSIAELSEGLRASVEQNRQAAAAMPTTVADAFTRLRTALQAWLGQANEGVLSTRTLAAGIAVLAEHINALAGGAVAALIAGFARWSGGLAVANVSQIAAAISARRLAASNLAAAESAVLGATNANQFAAAATRLAAAQTAAAAAGTGMAGIGRTLLGVLGGPVGLALTVGSLAAGWLLFRDNTKEAESALADISLTADQAREAFQKLSATQQSAELLNMKAVRDQLVVDTKYLARDMARALENEFASDGAMQGVARQLREMIQGAKPDFDAMGEAIRNNTNLTEAQRRENLNLLASLEKNVGEFRNLKARIADLSQLSPVKVEVRVGVNDADIANAKGEVDKIYRQIADLKDPSAVGKMVRNTLPGMGNIGAEMTRQLIDAAKAFDAALAASKPSAGGSKTDPFADKQRDLAKQLGEAQQQLANAQAGVADATNKSSSALDIWLKTAKEAATLSAGKKDQLRTEARAVDAVALAYHQFTEAKKRAESIQSGMAGVEIELLKLEGRSAEAARREFEQKYEELRAALQKEVAGGSLTAQVQLDAIIRLSGLEEARRGLDEVSAAIDKIESQNARDEQSLNAQVGAGLLTQIDARQKLIDLHRKTAAAIEAQIPKLRELAAAGGEQGEAALARLQELETKLLLLKQTSNEYEVALKNGLQSGLADAINGLAEGTMNLQNAVTALVRSIVDGMAKIAAQRLSEQLTEGVMGLFGGDKAASSAATTAATALTTSGAAAGGSLASGGVTAGQALVASATTAASILASASASGGSGGGGSLLGGLFSMMFAEGGYTGPGGKHQPAGIVHAGEYVNVTGSAFTVRFPAGNLQFQIDN